MAYGGYYVYAYCDEGNVDTDDLKIGAGVSLDEDEGPTGMIVKISGEGFDPDDVVRQGDVVIHDGTDEIPCYIIDEPVDVRSNGDLRVEIVIPSVPDKEDFDEIIIRVGDDEADADFDVLGDAEIEVSPQFGQPGADVNVKGFNFSQSDDMYVIIELWDEDLDDMEATLADGDDIETDEDGTFDEMVEIPAISSGNYKVVAYQVNDTDTKKINIDTMVSETDEDFRIGTLFVTLSDDEGETGPEVTLRGVGFTEDGDWNATFGDVVIFEDETADEDEIAGVFYVPSVPIGTYTVTVTDMGDDDSAIEVTTEFEVTNTTVASADPAEAPNEYNVTLEGYWLSEIDGGDLEFVIYNETDEWDMDVYITEDDKDREADLNDYGNYTAWWEVPEDDELSLGEYTVNVTDEEDLMAQFSFTIVPEKVEINPRKATFSAGDTVAFDIRSSFAEDDSYIEVMTPDGELLWRSDTFDEDDDWIKVGALRVVPYFKQTAAGNPMDLEVDAPTGTWTWVWYDTGDDEEPYNDDDEELDSGTFTVTPAAEEVLGEQIQSLSEDVSNLSDELDTVSQELAGEIEDTKAAISENSAKIDEMSSAVGDIASKADDAKSSAEDAKSAADDAKSAAENAATATGGLTGLVYGAIGASLVAAIAAIIALMQIRGSIVR
jgi:outer membrane murein-binding lipoprotein Lpp